MTLGVVTGTRILTPFQINRRRVRWLRPADVVENIASENSVACDKTVLSYAKREALLLQSSGLLTVVDASKSIVVCTVDNPGFNEYIVPHQFNQGWAHRPK